MLRPNLSHFTYDSQAMCPESTPLGSVDWDWEFGNVRRSLEMLTLGFNGQTERRENFRVKFSNIWRVLSLVQTFATFISVV